MQPQYNGPALIVQNPSRKIYPINSKCSIGLGIALIVIGTFSIIIQSIGTALGVYLGEAAAGIWSGLIFLTAGILGIVAGKFRTQGLVVAFMTFSILNASLFSVVMMTISAIALSNENDDHEDACESGRPFWRSCTDVEIALGMTGSLVVLSVAAGIVSIITSALTCRGFCCHDAIQEPRSHVVPYQHQPTMYVSPGSSTQQTAAYVTAGQNPPGYYQHQQNLGPQQNPRTTELHGSLQPQPQQSQADLPGLHTYGYDHPEPEKSNVQL